MVGLDFLQLITHGHTNSKIKIGDSPQPPTLLFPPLLCTSGYLFDPFGLYIVVWDFRKDANFISYTRPLILEIDSRMRRTARL